MTVSVVARSPADAVFLELPRRQPWKGSAKAVLVWIIVAVIPIALLGSVLGTSRGRPSRRRDGTEETWWAPEGEHRARSDRIAKPEEALDG
jgi:hypothetical protein